MCFRKMADKLFYSTSLRALFTLSSKMKYNTGACEQSKLIVIQKTLDAVSLRKQNSLQVISNQASNISLLVILANC